ncbi:MAG: OsmC family protein [Phycisphaerales bacterium]|nr:MAG: OsmC family protein [Phycisphaerales bacterium]
MAKEITLNYEGFLQANVKWSDGSSQVIGAPLSCGGSDDANSSPKDLFAAGYASCVAMTMDMAGRKHGFDIAGARVIVSPVWAEDKPVLAQLNTTVVLPGELAEDQLDVLRQGAHRCPIHNSLRETTETSLDFKVEQKV